MFNTDNALVGHSMMIGAKGNQVIEGVSTPICKGGDVVDMNVKIKPANSAPVIITNHGLLFNELPFAALPIPIQMACFRYARRQTITIAIITLLNLAREFINGATAIGARYGHFVLSPCGRCKALPFDIALALSASDLYLGGEGCKRLTTDGAGTGFLPSPVIAIVRASVLMGVYVSVLAGSLVRLERDYLAAPTGTIDNIRLFLFRRHKSIIHA